MAQNDEIEAYQWEALGTKIYDKMAEKTSHLWEKEEPTAEMKRLAGEVAEYRYKMEYYKQKGDMERSNGYKYTVENVAKQIEGKINEAKAYVKKGMLETLKEVLSEIIFFFIGAYLPFP